MLLATSLVVLLGGCATTAPPVQNPEQLRSTHGFVRVTLPIAGAGSRVLLRSVKDGTDHELRRSESLGTGVFGAWVPAGEYEVSSMRNPDGGRYLTVQVNAGQMTELGGLIPVQLGGYERLTLPIRHPEIAADASRALTQLSPYLKTTQTVEWTPTLVPKAWKVNADPTGLGLIADLMIEYGRHVNKPPLNQQLKQQTNVVNLYRLSLSTLPPQVEEPAVDDQGTLYFGAELGQVRVRRSDGVWSTIDTGILQTPSLRRTRTWPSSAPKYRVPWSSTAGSST